ncbi:MAG TPA: ClpXP adapter SpxH family protein [Saprospiraceae bacterium]|nr:ClpXP adapter SpxH family protein [Saprospiraceae bacterium]
MNWLAVFLFTVGTFGCQAQTKQHMKHNNPLLCDPATGICEMPGTGPQATAGPAEVSGKPLRIIYFTDPICSSCWGIEPQLRKLKLEYGSAVQVDYHMGGLLPDWTYNSGGISKPSDVAPHWDEVSHHYHMPIDGDVWLEDPLPSSYPPSIAFKAAQMQDAHRAVAFLRALRERLFLQKKNITKWEYVEQAAAQVGLDSAQLRKDYEGKAKELFQQDLQLARQLGVRGFPTLIVTDSSGRTDLIYGFRPYAAFEASIKKMHPDAAPTPYARDWRSLFGVYPTLTLQEYAELSGLALPIAQQTLDQLVAQRELSVFTCKNGSIWRRE